MFCAISGEVPTEPVVSPKSGLLFEKRLIEKALVATGGKCPQTGDDLSPEDLIPVKMTGKHARPTSSSATSFPAMLEGLQTGWDALMLEMHSLRKAVSKTRQELAHALYKQDAADRVIAKLIEEKKELQKELLRAKEAGTASLKRTHNGVNGGAKPPLPPAAADPASANVSEEPGAAADEPEPKRRKDAPAEEAPAAPASTNVEQKAVVDVLFNPSLVKAIEAESEVLKTKRKARKTSKGLSKSSSVSAYADVAQSVPATASAATCLLALDEKRVLAGFADGHASVLDPTFLTGVEGLSSLDLKHGPDGVTALVGLGGSAFASGGRDGFVRVWGAAGSPDPLVSEKRGAVDDLAGHPHGGLLLGVFGRDQWGWLDGEARSLSGGGGDGLVSCAVHPDGMLFAVGDEKGGVQMFDIKTMQKLLRLDGGWKGVPHGASSVAMSENGYYIAAGVDGRVALWDLRKQQVVKEIPVDGGGPLSVAIDHSGVYAAAVAPAGHVVFSTKKKAGVLAELEYEGAKGGRRQGVLWMPEAKALLTGHADGTVHRYSVTADGE